MKKIGLALIVLLVAGCTANKPINTDTTTDNKMNGAAINGTWEANYVAGTEKPFDELYPEMTPYIQFDLEEGRVSGMSGCNNFTGSFSVDENKLNLSDNMAMTRKMCPDMTGEDAFINSLQKVNSFSVSNGGETLNLIMGDIAIMRFIKIPGE